MRRWLAIGLVCLTWACREPVQGPEIKVAPRLRQTVVWLEDGVDEDLAARLKRAGVSLLVARRGTIDLRSGAPVMALERAPMIAGGIPPAAAFQVKVGGAELDPEGAAGLWRSLETSIGSSTSEIIVDLPSVAPGLGAYLRRFQTVSGYPVVPVLTVDQLRTKAGIDVARALGTVVVPLFGVEGSEFGVGDDAGPGRLEERLAPLVGTGVAVRVGVSLRPVTIPKLDVWGDDLNSLTEPNVAEIGTDTRLDRVFTFRRPWSWSGRRWAAGEKVEIGWMDTTRLHRIMGDTGRLILPEIAGWDLVPLPPAGGSLGIDRRALLAYLEGQGPAPDVAVEMHRQGRSVVVTMNNPGPFASAVSHYGSWVEISVRDGYLASDKPGTFDRVESGSVSRGEWKAGRSNGVNAVRFWEDYVAPGESLETGPVLLSSSRSTPSLRWAITLSDGTVVSGP